MKFENIILKKKKNFCFENNLRERNFQILGKFHDFIFSSPVFEQKSFPAGKDFHRPPDRDQENS